MLNAQPLYLKTVLSLLLAAPLYATDWPQWLGPQRDGVWRETGIVRHFKAGGPQVRWRQTISSGYAGPAVADGRVFVTDRVAETDNPETAQVGHYDRNKGGGSERVLCLRESDGALLWTHEYSCPYSVAYPAGPRATPTVHEGRVYTVGSEGDLFCLDAASGSVIFHCDMKKRYGLKVPVWGVCAPPLVDGDKLICIVGGDGSTAVALNKDTGQEIWRSLTSKSPGYSAPVIYNVGGTRQLMIWHGESMNSISPDTGKPYWSIPIKTWSGMAIATPRLLKRSLFVMGFQHRSTMIRLDPLGPKAQILWQGGREKGVAGAICTPFLEDGFIYGSGHNGVYRCVKIDTGERVWESDVPACTQKTSRWANAFTVKNEDHFFLVNDVGDLIIAQLSPQGYEEISRCHILEPTGRAEGRDLVWSHPAFANQSIYARNDKEIVCYSLKEE
jgi:outer membrane protein assembly factor BamB